MGTIERDREQLPNFRVVGEGDIVVADRMYGTKKGIEYLGGLSHDYVLRLRAKVFNGYNEEGAKLSVMERWGTRKPGKTGV